MDKRQSSLLIIISLLASVAVVVFMLGRPENLSSKPIFTPPPAIAQEKQKIEMTSVGSPDGKFTVSMQVAKGKETNEYKFYVSNSSGDKTEVFSKTLPIGDFMIIPQNTFSPDDKYLFLKEVSSGVDSYFVLTITGSAFPDGSQTYDIGSLFAAKYPEFKITDVTGWGGPGLVVINTDKAEGGIGPSFWFEAYSKGFIRLSNRFN